MTRLNHLRHHRLHHRLHSGIRRKPVRLGRTMGLLTLFAGLTAWFAMRDAMRREH